VSVHIVEAHRYFQQTDCPALDQTVGMVLLMVVVLTVRFPVWFKYNLLSIPRALNLVTGLALLQGSPFMTCDSMLTILLCSVAIPGTLRVSAKQDKCHQTEAVYSKMTCTVVYRVCTLGSL
jgi:hypothetical protein